MLEDLFLHSLQDIYWAENHLLKALPKMQKAATSAKLKAAFADHTEVTAKQAKRLEEAFRMLGEKAKGKKCEAMTGLVEEGQSIIDETESGTATRDVGLIMAAQKVEHYEIAAYGTLVTLARQLDKNDMAELLEKTLFEEKETDMLLTKIAESGVNYNSRTERAA